MRASCGVEISPGSCQSAKAALFYVIDVIALSLAGAIAAAAAIWGGSTPLVTMLTPAAAVLVMRFLVNK